MQRIKKFFQYDNIGLLFALPAFLYMLIFVGYPIISNLILSVQDVTMRNLVQGEKTFVGLKNYHRTYKNTPASGICIVT